MGAILSVTNLHWIVSCLLQTCCLFWSFSLTLRLAWPRFYTALFSQPSRHQTVIKFKMVVFGVHTSLCMAEGWGLKVFSSWRFNLSVLQGAQLNSFRMTSDLLVRVKSWPLRILVIAMMKGIQTWDHSQTTTSNGETYIQDF